MNPEIIEESRFEKAREKIRKSKGKEIIFTSSDDELNRKVLEKEKIDTLLIKQKGRKDFQKQRNSGLNSVMAKAAKKSGAKIGIFLDEIIESEGKEKSGILARVKQNIRQCSKNKLKMRFISLKTENQRNYHDLASLGLVLGMPTWMTKSLDAK